jgi:hypothetical protein
LHVWRDQLSSVRPECVVTSLQAAKATINAALGVMDPAKGRAPERATGASEPILASTAPRRRSEAASRSNLTRPASSTSDGS